MTPSGANAQLRQVQLQNGPTSQASDPEAKMFLRLVLDTGLRMKDAYTLRVSQIDFARGHGFLPRWRLRSQVKCGGSPAC